MRRVLHPRGGVTWCVWSSWVALAPSLAACLEGAPGPSGPRDRLVRPVPRGLPVSRGPPGRLVLRGPVDAPGSAGPAGPRGPQGTPAAPASANITVRAAACPAAGCLASCEGGESLIGGYCVNHDRGMQHMAVFSAREGRTEVEGLHEVKQVVAVCLKP